MNEISLKRLALIKQLFMLGVAQSYEPEPLNGFSILSFHDSLEMFVKLCADCKPQYYKKQNKTWGIVSQHIRY